MVVKSSVKYRIGVMLMPLLALILLTLCSCRTGEIVKYDPPRLIIVTESGSEYTATRFGYRWERERKEDAVDFVEPYTYEYEPIEMKEGESCYLRFGEGYAPEMYIVAFYPKKGGEKQTVDYTINYHGYDPRYAENYRLLLPPVTESGIYTVDAVWPEWITNSIVTDATYGFEVSVQTGAK